MKKSYYFLSVLSISIAPLGCHKDNDEKCYSCTITQTEVIQGAADPDFDKNAKGVSKIEFCGTRNQLEAYEKTGTFSVSNQGGGATIVLTTTTKCNR